MSLRGALGLALGVLLAGCTLGPDYRAPEAQMPDSFVDPAGALAPRPPEEISLKPAKSNAAPIEFATWWRAFGDAELDTLVARAIAGNLDLEAALDRLQEARTHEAVVLGLSLPTADAGAATAKGSGDNTIRGRVPSVLEAGENPGAVSQINMLAGFEAGWELDLFGKYRRAIEAARYDREAAAAARNAALIAVISDTVRAYVDLRGLQTRLAILSRNIAIEQHTFDVVNERFTRGLTNELDVTLAKRELATLQATMPPLAARIAAAEDTIAILTGAMPRALAKELDTPAAIPALPEKIAPGLPLDLLRRRPDIDAAERRLAAATARIGVATADLFPHLVLTGAIGAQGQGLGVGPAALSSLYSVGPSAYWNVLDFGTLDGIVEIADLRTKEQLAVYKRAVLDAVEQVDNAITDYAAQQGRLKSLGVALAAAQRAVDLAQARYDRGLTDFLNVLDAERQQYELEAQYAEAQQQAADDFATLYKALGGGWEQYQSVPPIRQPLPAIVAAFRALFEPPEAAKTP
jgi:NodT family efflux transporter outer membrane factor (OMF) lipoprotein